MATRAPDPHATNEIGSIAIKPKAIRGEVILLDMAVSDPGRTSFVSVSKSAIGPS